MRKVIGRNINTTPTASIVSTVTVNDSTAVVVAPANPDRIFLEISAPPVGVTNNHDYCVFLRLYAASQDNTPHGLWLGSYQVGNDSLFKGVWRMPQGDIYTGEVSAILCAGDADVILHITEY